jgi:deoxyribose-phosphate aldolase
MKERYEDMKKAKDMTKSELAMYIDHSVLKPEFTADEIREHIQEGVDYGCATVCVNPSAMKVAQQLCEGSSTKICVVCDFPFGLSTTESRVLQAREYCKTGYVFELDIVANYGLMKSGLWDEVLFDLTSVIAECHTFKIAVKVILETDALNMDEIKKGTEIAIEAGADFVKTSTGFYTGGPQKGATVEIISEMLKISKGRAKIKGSGCIRTKEHFMELIDLGIDRMGVGYRSTPVVLAD